MTVGPVGERDGVHLRCTRSWWAHCPGTAHRDDDRPVDADAAARGLTTTHCLAGAADARLGPLEPEGDPWRSGVHAVAGCADFGRLGGAVYRIEIPRRNGRLVLFMHGFEEFGPEADVTAPDFRRYLIARGYAWGAPSSAARR
jgi:hypothetical protein